MTGLDNMKLWCIFENNSLVTTLAGAGVSGRIILRSGLRKKPSDVEE